MSRILAPDSGFMLFLSKLFDILLISLFFLVCCIPVVTIGPAFCALYASTRKVVLKREGYVAREYFHSFRINLAQGMIAWIILFVIMALMGINIFYTATTWKNVFGVVATGIYFAVLCVVLIVGGYLFPILSRFECKGKRLIGSAFMMAIEHPAASILLLFLQIIFYVLLVMSYAGFPLLLFFIPVGYAVLQQRILEKIFVQYMEDESDGQETI